MRWLEKGLKNNGHGIIPEASAAFVFCHPRIYRRSPRFPPLSSHISRTRIVYIEAKTSKDDNSFPGHYQEHVRITFYLERERFKAKNAQLPSLRGLSHTENMVLLSHDDPNPWLSIQAGSQ